jgi:hypothetical protein
MPWILTERLKHTIETNVLKNLWYCASQRCRKRIKVGQKIVARGNTNGHLFYYHEKCVRRIP